MTGHISFNLNPQHDTFPRFSYWVTHVSRETVDFICREDDAEFQPYRIEDHSTASIIQYCEDSEEFQPDRIEDHSTASIIQRREYHEEFQPYWIEDDPNASIIQCREDNAEFQPYWIEDHSTASTIQCREDDEEFQTYRIEDHPTASITAELLNVPGPSCDIPRSRRKGTVTEETIRHLWDSESGTGHVLATKLGRSGSIKDERIMKSQPELSKKAEGKRRAEENNMDDCNTHLAASGPAEEQPEDSQSPEQDEDEDEEDDDDDSATIYEGDEPPGTAGQDTTTTEKKKKRVRKNKKKKSKSKSKSKAQPGLEVFEGPWADVLRQLVPIAKTLINADKWSSLDIAIKYCEFHSLILRTLREKCNDRADQVTDFAIAADKYCITIRSHKDHFKQAVQNLIALQGEKPELGKAKIEQLLTEQDQEQLKGLQDSLLGYFRRNGGWGSHIAFVIKQVQHLSPLVWYWLCISSCNRLRAAKRQKSLGKYKDDPTEDSDFKELARNAFSAGLSTTADSFPDILYPLTQEDRKETQAKFLKADTASRESLVQKAHDNCGDAASHPQVILPLPILPGDWTAEKDFKALGSLSAATQRSIEPVGPHFLAHARRARHKRTFSEDDRIQAQENVKKVEEDDSGEISEPEDPSMLLRDAKDWKSQDHYAVLGLSKYRFKATEEQIKRAHRKKVLKHHPDKKAAAGSTEDDSFFKCIQKATEVLLDPVKRRQFDSVDERADVEPPSKKQLKDGKYYKLWSNVFKAEGRFSRVQPVPKLGDENSTQEEVENFYNFFYNFDSWRSFEYQDEDVPDDNENRDQKRHMERKNNNARKKKKNEDVARLRTLVDQVMAGDERIKKFRQAANASKNKKKNEKEAADKKAAEEAKAAKEAEAKAAKEAEEKAKLDREQGKKAKEAAKAAVKKNRRVMKGSVKDANYFVSGDASAASIDAVLNDVDLIQGKIDPDETAALAGKLNGLKLADEIKSVWSGEVKRLVEAGKIKDGEVKTIV